MADEENTESRDDEVAEGEASQPDGPCAEFRMELVDSLPGGRAVIGVEQEGAFMWLASKRHVSQQAVDEFTDQMTKIVHAGWWAQNWPGAR